MLQLMNCRKQQKKSLLVKDVGGIEGLIGAITFVTAVKGVAFGTVVMGVTFVTVVCFS